MKEAQPIYGLMAEFDSAEELLRAAKKARLAGYKKLDAFTPFPIEGLTEALGKKKSLVPFLVFFGGAFGCLGGFFMEWFANVIHYRINSGGRPYNSWPAFIPITFELTILFAGFTALFALIFLNRQPQLYHPVFNAPNFERASLDKFFLCIQSDDIRFNLESTGAFMRNLGAQNVTEIAS